MATKKKKKLLLKSPKTKQAKRYKAAIKRARPKHRKILLHPATIMVLLCAGVLIINFTRSSNADNVLLSAVVPAPALSEGATITSPTGSSTVSSSPVTVSGTCPDNSYINLSNNGIFAGSAACVSQEFSITVALSKGMNDLLAQDYNSTNDPGPITSTVYVTYTPPPSSPITITPSQTAELQGNSSTVTTETLPATAASTSSSSLAPVLTANYSFKTFLTSSQFTWQIDLSGGTPPYIAVVSWGDGTSTTYKFNVDPLFSISHTYSSTGYYPVVIHAVDSKDKQTYLQIAALIHTPKSIGFAGIIKSNPPPTTTSSKTSKGLFTKVHSLIWIIWPTYGFVLLMVVSFWLGERQEYLYLMKKQKPAHRHR
jgi:hypothetical protein